MIPSAEFSIVPVLVSSSILLLLQDLLLWWCCCFNFVLHLIHQPRLIRCLQLVPLQRAALLQHPQPPKWTIWPSLLSYYPNSNLDSLITREFKHWCTWLCFLSKSALPGMFAGLLVGSTANTGYWGLISPNMMASKFEKWFKFPSFSAKSFYFFYESECPCVIKEEGCMICLYWALNLCC